MRSPQRPNKITCGMIWLRGRQWGHLRVQKHHFEIQSRSVKGPMKNQLPRSNTWSAVPLPCPSTIQHCNGSFEVGRGQCPIEYRKNLCVCLSVHTSIHPSKAPQGLAVGAVAQKVQGTRGGIYAAHWGWFGAWCSNMDPNIWRLSKGTDRYNEVSLGLL